MRSLAKAIEADTPAAEAYCITNTSRPLLSVCSRTDKTQRKTYVYVEALRSYRFLVPKLDLSEAYKKAGVVFKDRMEHCFVVLTDEGAQKLESGDKRKGTVASVSGANAQPVGGKRRAPPGASAGPVAKKAN